MEDRRKGTLGTLFTILLYSLWLDVNNEEFGRNKEARKKGEGFGARNRNSISRYLSIRDDFACLRNSGRSEASSIFATRNLLSSDRKE